MILLVRKATWGRLEIKIYVVGMEYLDLNTSVGDSLSENVCWKCRHVLMALSMNEERGWRGIYSLHTKSNRYTQFTKLVQTDSFHIVIVRHFGGTDMINSVGPMC